jgi:hypothetical protein
MIVFRADHKVLTSESEILAPATSYSRRRQVRSRLPSSVRTPRRAATRIGKILQTKSKNSIGPLTPIRAVRQRQNLESAGDVHFRGCHGRGLNKGHQHTSITAARRQRLQ